MGIFRKLAISAAFLAVPSSFASAADVIEEPVYVPPEVSVSVGGWYLRGDIGMSNQKLHGDLYNVLMDSADTDNFDFIDDGSFDSAPMMRLGLGYQYNDMLRFDATVEYRGKADFNALDRYSCLAPCGDDDAGTWDGTNDYSAKKSEWLLMANAYADLGTWMGVTPYVGAGIGAARVKISGFEDVNVPNNGVAYASDHAQWNLAWALHAGLGVDLNDRLRLDLGYSYTNLGDGKTGDVIAYDGTNDINNPMKFNDIVSHDLRFGLIYKVY